jgi:rhodanese-related sulfurtransferase
MKTKRVCVLLLLIVAVALLSFVMAAGVHAAEAQQGKGDCKETVCSGVEISTEELRQILSAGKIPVIDVRPPKEYAISHIPGSVSIFETDLDAMMKATPDKSSGPVLCCNGPFCGKTTRVAEKLWQKGYGSVKKYREGLPVWRAFGNTAETNISGFKYVYGADKTAVFVDARSKEEFKTGTIPGAVNIPQAGEIEAANNDGRLPYTDHGTRVIVFGSTIPQAKKLAEAIAKRAYWNSSYLAGTYDELYKLLK